MPRRSRTQITADYAKRIVKKLKGQRSGECDAHKYFDVYTVDGKLYLTQLSLRHGSGSRPYLGHDHMIGQLGVNAYTAKELARCNVTREEWANAFQDSSHGK